MNNWVLIADSSICPYSKQQLETIKEVGAKLQGAILCNEEQNKDSKVCKEIDAFPAFCNTATNKCVIGLRKTHEELEELNKM